MKSFSFVSTALFAAIAAARPRAQDEPLKQVSRVTAFVVNDKGDPSVECWEISSAVSTMGVKRTDGSKGTAHALSLVKGGSLDGVDILTWPSSSAIWPPTSDSGVAVDNFDLSNTFNLFNIQGGLINFNYYVARFGMSTPSDEDVESHIFSVENGDDWFYFEDGSESSTMNKKTPFSFETVSATETELLRLRYSSQPKHTLVHKGACSFSGVDTSGAPAIARESTHDRSPLTVQVRIEDL
jgi:hypothetical protein